MCVGGWGYNPENSILNLLVPVPKVYCLQNFNL